MARERYPGSLTWEEVDPGRQPFDPSTALAVVQALPSARTVPSRPQGEGWAGRMHHWSSTQGSGWTAAITTELVAGYGPWVIGWRWAHGEGDVGGGPVSAWCCPQHSITTPPETVVRVAQALVEWRAWIEELDGLFASYLPSPITAPVDERLQVWERAVGQIVTLVVERTEADDTWYGHCAQVLTWFLARAGVGDAAALVDEAIGGRFESWVAPEEQLVVEVAARVALDVVAHGDR